MANYGHSKKILILLISILIFGCKSIQVSQSNHFKLNFLSEYILPANTVVDKTQIGGLSGIDFYNGTYYLVCDDAGNPRFYKATIDIENNKISNVHIEKVIKIKNNPDFLDLESIRIGKNTNQILLTSEGSIRNKKNPSFFSVNLEGELQERFKIPDAFKAGSPDKPRDNATLEGLSNSSDNKGYWVAMELPLEVDGPEPQLTNTKSPVRITYIGLKTKRPEKQFAYFLDPVAKKAVGNFSINGLSDLLEYDTNKFLVIERSYSSGLGTQGNTIKLYKGDAANATNTLKIKSLKNSNFVPAKKELLFDFEDVRNQLTNNSIDNIEGITFGPLLSNGHKSLILISDNNFNTLGPQLNQFILLEIVE